MLEQSRLHHAPVHERRLDNGLTLLVREDRSAPVIAVVTHVLAGYFDEPDRLVGISHVLEHMYFKGTERRGVGEIARETKAGGGYLNAGTIYDHTSYYTVVPSSALELALDIQSDALLNAAIDDDELRKELLVIIQEAKRKLDNPHAVAAEALYEEMFDVHPIRRWRIGTEEGLKRLRREDVWQYYRNLYRPSNIILVVAGDVEPDHVHELVDRYYGPMPAGEPVREPARAEPDRHGFRFREIDGDIVHAHAEWGWRTPGTLHPDTPLLDLLAIVMGQGRASRLFRGVREAGFVFRIAAYNYTPTEVGVFGVSAELPPADTRAALRRTWQVVARLLQRGVAPAELDRAKNIAEARMLRRTESVEGQATLLADWHALGDWRLADAYLDRLIAATTDDVLRVATTYLGLDRATLLLYRPRAAPAFAAGEDAVETLLRSVTDDDVGEAPAPREETSAAARAAAPAAAAAAGSDASAGTAAPDGAMGEAADVPPAVALPDAPPAGRSAAGTRPARPAAFHVLGTDQGVHLYELPDGARIAVKPRPASPLVSMGVFWRGGPVHEAADDAGISGLLARLSIKGTHERSAAEIAEETEALGGAIAPGVSSDLIHWTLSLPSHHFAQGFGLLADVVQRPAFPQDEIERERRVALSDLEQLRDDMYRYPLRLFLQAAFRGHTYGFSLAEAEQGIRSVTRTQLEEWHRSELLEARPWILVVGGIDPDHAAQRIAAEIDRIAAFPTPAERAVRPSWPAGPHQESEHRAKEQTALVLGFPGPMRDDPDVYALQVLSNAIGGLGGRLFEELRGRQSLAYTVAAYPIVRRLAGAFVAYIATSPDKEDQARDGLIQEFERLTTESLEEAEVDRSKRYTIGAWKIRSQTNGAQMWDLADALLLGTGLDELRTFESRILVVTPTQIREAARRYFDPDRLVEGIVRGGQARV